MITGASSGIGKATALLFAKRGGFHLSLSGRNEEALDNCVKECALGPESILTTVGDLREQLVSRSLVTRTIEKFGRIDILVNSAGILVNGTVSDTPVVELDRQFDINVRSVVELTQQAIPHLVANKGTVVNVSSVAGQCAFPGVTYYCMSKAALDQFTKCLALELAPKGVRVNAVNPGVVVTDVHRRAGMSEQAYTEFLKRGEQTHALGRVATADEVARAIFFLSTAESSFTTGHLLSVDGGRSLMTPR